ncbi:outer membrane beta-barrel protein [Pseudoduganella danionis]|uniref:Outer membrane beta-barrel protein n=1 Tax=Pseudoduganella danionis TaxID=1890295 RepID=A0ABW9SU70_9BURK|nr:outer membrane beta-barrel protein [Pseudoduganella danionis]
MRSSFAALLGLAVALPAFASDPFEPGVYAGVNLGRASISSKYVESGHDATGGFAIGYQMTPNLGAEVFASTLSFDPFKGLLAAPGNYPDSHIGVAVLGSIPLSDQFSLYGRLGIGRTKMPSTRTSLPTTHETDPSIGIGASYAISRQWSVNLEATRLTKTEVNLLSAGLRFQF